MILRDNEIKVFSARFSLTKFFIFPFLLLMAATALIYVAMSLSRALFDPVYLVGLLIIFSVVFKEKISLESFNETRIRFTSRRKTFLRYEQAQVYFFDEIFPFDSVECLCVKDGLIFKKVALRLKTGEERLVSGYDINFSFD